MEKIKIKGKEPYEVFVGEKIIFKIGELIKQKLNCCCKVVLICDELVFKIYGNVVKKSLEKTGFLVLIFSLKGEEKSKNFENLIKVYSFLFKNNVKRKDLILALGGGMVGDFAGFCAATYLRGIKFVNIPTTLLAQVDSSIGGKTAVNLKFGKNLVGVIKSPFLVVCDVFFLKTLSFRMFNAGVSEIIKMAAIFSKELFKILAKEEISNVLEDVVVKSIEIKKDVVEKDEFEKNVRMKLNFGHTIGHALEKALNFKIHHGEAVAVGMCLITKQSVKLGITNFKSYLKLKALLEKYSLPVETDVNFNLIFENIMADKKIFGDEINFCVMKKIGEGEIMSLPILKFKDFLKGWRKLKMEVKIKSSQLTGTLKATSSKSFAMRAILAASFSEGSSQIKNVELCDDVKTIILIMKKFGVKFEFKNKMLKVFGGLNKEKTNEKLTLNCDESGFCFRIISFLAAAYFNNFYLKVSECLAKRPLSCLIKLNGKNFNYVEKVAECTFKVTEKLVSGKFEVDGSVSSQFISALFFVLPTLKGKSEIVIKNKLVSKPYLNMTLKVLKSFGVKIKKTLRGFKISGGQKFLPCNFKVEGDFSQAAFFEVLGVLNPVKIIGLKKNSCQGDKKILNVIKFCGAGVKFKKNFVLIFPKKRKLKAFSFSVEDAPDLAPPLAVLACFCSGISKIKGVKRLAFKESNRINSILELINGLGGEAFLEYDVIKIKGGAKLKGGEVKNFKDHRIIMAAFIISCFCEDFVFVSNIENVFKSNLNFFEDFKMLGGNFSGICF